MDVEIFDKETILDLMVNFIPLGIIFFFIAAFVLYDPWGFDPRFSGLMLAIMGGMFIALTVLTYVSAKAIAGDEKRATVYPQGQAGLEGAEPIHEHNDDAESKAETVDGTANADGEDLDGDDAENSMDAESDEPVVESAGESTGNPESETADENEQTDNSDSESTTSR